MSAPLLAVRDLVAGFRTDAGFAAAVDGVTLTLARGETLGLVGESGCGKSALSLAIMGLLPASGRIAGGVVAFDGQELTRLAPRALRRLRGRRMAMVFQDPMTALNPYLRAGEQIAEPLRVHLGMPRAAARARAVELLREVGVPEPEMRVDRFPHELSGGQRQRVMIAMALACGPDLLLADEPTTALDVTIQAQILALLKAQQRRRGLAMVLVTHDLGVVAGTCDRVAVMYAGRIVEEAPVEALFAHPRHPYTRALLACRPDLAHERGAALPAIAGLPPSPLARPAGCAFAPRCPHAADACRAAPPPEREAAPGHRHRCLRVGEAGGPS